MAFQLDNIQKPEVVTKDNGDQLSFLKKEIVLFKKSFSNTIKEEFYTELSVLLKAGINLKDALELIRDSQKKQTNKDVLQSLLKSIVSGESLSEATKIHKQFSDYEYYSLKIGEETGTLAEVTEQLGDFFARKNEQRKNLISALTYPIIILTTAVLVVIFMLQFVVPMFEDIFEQQNVELPMITKIIINVSEFIRQYGLLLLLMVFGIYYLGVFLKKKRVV